MTHICQKKSILLREIQKWVKMVKHDSEGNALKVGMKVLVTLETPYGFHSAQHAMEKSA